MKQYTVSYYTVRSGERRLTTSVMAENYYEATQAAEAKIRTEHKTIGFIISSISETK